MGQVQKYAVKKMDVLYGDDGKKVAELNPDGTVLWMQTYQTHKITDLVQMYQQLHSILAHLYETGKLVAGEACIDATMFDADVAANAAKTKQL